MKNLLSLPSALIAGAALSWSPRALAATYSVTFCFQYAVSFTDAKSTVGDDYLTSDASPLAARGVQYSVTQVAPLDTISGGYTPWTGNGGEGCSPTLTLDSNRTYNVYANSRMLVNDNIIKIYDDDTSPAYYGFGLTGYVPTASGTVTITSPVNSGWNVAAAATQALGRRNVGLSGEDVIFYTQACGTWPGGTPASGSCMRGSTGEVYVSQLGSSAPGAGQKYVVVHEMGHEMAFLANGGHNADKDEAANQDGCHGVVASDPGHDMTSKEYQGQAVNEGLAHYYAAVAFNNTTQDDCHFEYYKAVDLNGDGSASLEYPRLTCEGGTYWYWGGAFPIPYTDGDWMFRDYVEESCEQLHPGGTLGNRATELDWLRFFWDLDHDQGVTTKNIFDIWDESEPQSWTKNGSGSNFTCGTTSWPSGRLRCAADTEGVLDEWDAEFAVNGVNR